MGLAASQARLLSLTTRLTNNEMGSQTITNAKIRLASKSSSANKVYIDALSAAQLMYSNYNGDGEKTYEALTVAIINQYAPLKNQYGIIDNHGKLLVKNDDGENFKKSKDIYEFLGLQELIDYPALVESNKKLENLLNQISTKDILMNEQKEILYVNEWTGTDLEGNEIDGKGGLEGQLVDWNTRKPSDKDDKYLIETPGTSNDLYLKFEAASQSCYMNAMKGHSGCYLHVLAHMLDLEKREIYTINTGKIERERVKEFSQNYETSLGDNITITHNNINGSAISNQMQTSNMVSVSEAISNNFNVIYAAENPDDTLTASSSKVDKLLSNYYIDSKGEKQLKTLKQKIIDLFYTVQNYSSLGIDYNATLKPALEGFQNDMTLAFVEITLDREKFDADMEKWQKIYDKMDEKFNHHFKIHENLLNERIILVKEYDIEYAHNQSLKEYDDKDMGKWYVNLWHRMNGADIDKSKEGETGKNFVILNDTLLNSKEWIKYALESGAVTLEQVRYNENPESETGLKNHEWKSMIFSAASDISSIEDEKAVTLAEAKYNKTIKDIEHKDKQYDMDLKRLDTEHNALQTEYDSLKSVIQKNQERSFKTFS